MVSPYVGFTYDVPTKLESTVRFHQHAFSSSMATSLASTEEFSTTVAFINLTSSSAASTSLALLL
jgi:hypothetical protein